MLEPKSLLLNATCSKRNVFLSFWFISALLSSHTKGLNLLPFSHRTVEYPPILEIGVLSAIHQMSVFTLWSMGQKIFSLYLNYFIFFLEVPQVEMATGQRGHSYTHASSPHSNTRVDGPGYSSLHSIKLKS